MKPHKTHEKNHLYTASSSNPVACGSGLGQSLRFRAMQRTWVLELWSLQTLNPKPLNPEP